MLDLDYQNMIELNSITIYFQNMKVFKFTPIFLLYKERLFSPLNNQRSFYFNKKCANVVTQIYSVCVFKFFCLQMTDI